MSYILGVKSGDHQALFDTVDQCRLDERCQEHTVIDDEGIEHGYRWVNGLSLNKSHPDLKVNFLEYREIKDGKETIWTWVTD